jgi:hypothetical protein
MNQKNDEKRKLIIEKISKTHNITEEEAKANLHVLEIFCEIIIKYTLKNPDDE